MLGGDQAQGSIGEDRRCTEAERAGHWPSSRAARRVDSRRHLSSSREGEGKWKKTLDFFLPLSSFSSPFSSRLPPSLSLRPSARWRGGGGEELLNPSPQQQRILLWLAVPFAAPFVFEEGARVRREFRASNNKETPTPGPRARERGALDDGKKEKRREPLPPPGRYQDGAFKRARFRALNAATEEAGAARSDGKGADRAPLAGTEARGGGETGDAFPFFFLLRAWSPPPPGVARSPQRIFFPKNRLAHTGDKRSLQTILRIHPQSENGSAKSLRWQFKAVLALGALGTEAGPLSVSSIFREEKSPRRRAARTLSHFFFRSSCSLPARFRRFWFADQKNEAASRATPREETAFL